MRKKFLEFVGQHNTVQKNRIQDDGYVRKVLLSLLPVDLKLHFVEKEKFSIEKEFYYEEHIVAELNSVRSESVLLRPKDARSPLPVVIAFHDHGGYYFHGKERLYMDAPFGSFMFEYRKKGYQGKRWVLDLVKNGFAVFCPDAFYFGSRRLSMEIIEKFVGNDLTESLRS